MCAVLARKSGGGSNSVRSRKVRQARGLPQQQPGLFGEGGRGERQEGVAEPSIVQNRRVLDNALCIAWCIHSGTRLELPFPRRRYEAHYILCFSVHSHRLQYRLRAARRCPRRPAGLRPRLIPVRARGPADYRGGLSQSSVWAVERPTLSIPPDVSNVHGVPRLDWDEVKSAGALHQRPQGVQVPRGSARAGAEIGSRNFVSYPSVSPLSEGYCSYIRSHHPPKILLHSLLHLLRLHLFHSPQLSDNPRQHSRHSDLSR